MYMSTGEVTRKCASTHLAPVPGSLDTHMRVIASIDTHLRVTLPLDMIWDTMMLLLWGDDEYTAMQWRANPEDDT